ncbi:hypothetical protein ACXZ1K_00950 [Pedobacter sp. PWIIR3]
MDSEKTILLFCTIIFKFDEQLEILKGRSNTMGIEELLLDRAKHEGISEGKHENAVEIAREMKKEGFSIDQIIKFTKLTSKEIEEL